MTVGATLRSRSLKTREIGNKTMKWIKQATLLVSFVILSTVLGAVFPINAAAVSLYDDAVQTVNTLQLKSSNGSHTANISTSYAEYLDDCSSSSHGDSFNSAADQSVFMVRSGTKEYAVIIWSTAEASANFYAAGSEQRLQAESSTGYASVELNNSGNTVVTCDFADYTWPISNNSNLLYGETFGSWSKLFFSTYTINYPTGYEGNYAPTTPPSPPESIYDGSVDCGIDSLEYMLITQDGNTDPVTLNYESTYKASWSHSLTSSPYSITVGCGNTLAASYESVTPMSPTSNDWICDTVNDPHYCVLS